MLINANVRDYVICEWDNNIAQRILSHVGLVLVMRDVEAGETRNICVTRHCNGFVHTAARKVNRGESLAQVQRTGITHSYPV